MAWTVKMMEDHTIECLVRLGKSNGDFNTSKAAEFMGDNMKDEFLKITASMKKVALEETNNLKRMVAVIHALNEGIMEFAEKIYAHSKIV